MCRGLLATEKRSQYFLLLLLIGVLLLWPWSNQGLAKEEPSALYIIERDTLQTRNFTPIINHHTMVVNVGERPLKLELTSDIPPGKFRQGEHYPAFLEDSLLPDPLFSPIEVSPTKVSHLGQPEMVTDRDHTSFVWKEVFLSPGEAVIAQYDSFFGEPKIYWQPQGLEIFGLRVHTHYTARRLKGSSRELSFEYEVINSTGSILKDVSLEIFIPLRRIDEEKETTLLELRQICSSPNVEVSRITKVDGFGEAASGVAVTLWIEEMEANGNVNFFLRLSASQVIEAWTLWPIISLHGRSLQAPAWPPTFIKAEVPVRKGRFSYLAFNLVIQDSRVLELSPKGIKVKPASGASK